MMVYILEREEWEGWWEIEKVFATKSAAEAARLKLLETPFLGDVIITEWDVLE